MNAKTKAARRSGNYDTRQVCTAHRPSQQRKYNTVKPLRSYRSFDEMRADYRRLGKSTLPVELLAVFPAIVFAVLAIAMMALFGWGCS